MLNSKILLIVTGSISAYRSLDLVSMLRKSGYNIKVIMTKSAQEFVTPLSFSALSNGEVYSDLFDSRDPMSHIELTRWADKIVVVPATANYINKIASGVTDDLASNIYLSHKFDKPFIIYPAMNTSMLDHPQTQTSLNKLREFGITIGDTDKGVLACGEVGAGKLLEINKIFTQLTELPLVKGHKVLITSGGTREPIDGVRHIGNMSSGKTGHMIARVMGENGAEITFLHAVDTIPPKDVEAIQFSSFKSLDELLKQQLSENYYDCIIHLAAISDYSVDYLKDESGNKVNTSEKLSSSQNYSIHLKKNPKIIQNLQAYSKNKDINIIGFKLTHTLSTEKQNLQIDSVFNNDGVDYVVHNELTKIKDSSHDFTIHSREHEKIELKTKEELARSLSKLVQKLPKINEERV